MTTQLNPIEAYQEAGRKSCKARKVGDEACARFHADWAKRAMRLESDDYAKEANDAFLAAYRKESGFY